MIGCNPSDAGTDKEDPTSRWWNGWFYLGGYAGYDVVNLYPFVTADPRECRKRYDNAIKGPAWDDHDALFANAAAIATAAKQAEKVFVCWGSIAWDQEWIEHIVETIQHGEEPWPDLWCWGTTQSGAPKHPLARGKHRIAVDQPAVLWRAAR